MSRRRAIVVGAGIGGLVAGLDLARQGLHVTVLERAQRVGGKLREVVIGGRAIDSGPTVFTMPWIFEEIFADAGSALEAHLKIEPAEVLARHAWPDGGRLDLYADRERTAAAIAGFAGREEAQGYLRFCDRARRTFETLYRPFIRSQRPGVGSLIAASGVRGLGELWRIRPFQSLWRALGAYFRDPRLRSLFARYATYCGSSPLQAPATLMLIAHVEQRGVWTISGGMQRLPQALASLLTSMGGEIRCNAPVAEIGLRNGRAAGVHLESGEWLPADAVVANADPGAIRQGMLGAATTSAVPPAALGPRSLSAVTWSLVARTSGFPLAHHNVFFPEDYPREFAEIFDQRRLPRRPAVYVCAQERGADERATTGAERLFLIANAPAEGDRASFGADAVAPLWAAVLELLEQCDLGLETTPARTVTTTPAEFEQRFPGTGGALYGTALHGWRASFNRPGARTRIPGLYLAGGSVHPGAGVPMAAITGRLAAEAAGADLGVHHR